MKILLLSDLNSVHTQRWAHSLALRGIRVHVVGILPLNKKTSYYDHPEISLHALIPELQEQNSLKSKLKYLKGLPRLKSLIQQLQPDLINAHFATSYGLLGALAKDRPLLLTLWGDDVLIFPKKSPLHAKIVKFNLNRADAIFATSAALINASKSLVNKKVTLIPFGVETELFKPQHEDHKEIVIGTIKSLELIYGIDILLNAIRLLKQNCPGINLKFIIVGGGAKEHEFKQLAKQLGIYEDVIFTGQVNHAEIVQYHQKMDVFVALSRSESFGVSVVEAMSCGKPCVVSNVGGLPEVVINGQTGFVVPSEDPSAAASAIEKLVKDETLRKSFGYQGRKRVLESFDWKQNVEQMIGEFKKFEEKR